MAKAPLEAGEVKFGCPCVYQDGRCCNKMVQDAIISESGDRFKDTTPMFLPELGLTRFEFSASARKWPESVDVREINERIRTLWFPRCHQCNLRFNVGRNQSSPQTLDEWKDHLETHGETICQHCLKTQRAFHWHEIPVFSWDELRQHTWENHFQCPLSPDCSAGDDLPGAQHMRVHLQWSINEYKSIIWRGSATADMSHSRLACPYCLETTLGWITGCTLDDWPVFENLDLLEAHIRKKHPKCEVRHNFIHKSRSVGSYSQSALGVTFASNRRSCTISPSEAPGAFATFTPQ